MLEIRVLGPLEVLAGGRPCPLPGGGWRVVGDGAGAPVPCRCDGGVIEASDLTKRYGARTAVDGLSFSVRPGVVTGFLGPNGAGKSTTMRLALGLDAPTRGRVTIDGRAYADLPAPLREVGALLEARAAHPGRTARNHLLALAATCGARCGRSARCSRRGRTTRGAPPAPT